MYVQCPQIWDVGRKSVLNWAETTKFDFVSLIHNHRPVPISQKMPIFVIDANCQL